jgi:hypothetical protein
VVSKLQIYLVDQWPTDKAFDAGSSPFVVAYILLVFRSRASTWDTRQHHLDRAPELGLTPKFKA